MNKTKINYESAIKRFKNNIDNAFEYFNSLSFASQKMLLAALAKEESLKSYAIFLRNYLKKEEYVKSFQAFNLEEINKIRDTVKQMSLKHQSVVLTMLNTGCRKFEVNEVWKNYNGNRICKIWGKGQKLAKIYIDEELQEILNQWVFSNDFKTFSEKQLENIVKQVLSKAELKGNTHDIRRAFATNLRLHNTPIEQIQILLRHDDIKTTIGYIKITDEEIFESLKRRYINVEEYVNQTNFRQVTLDLIIKNQNQGLEIEKLKKEIENLKNGKMSNLQFK